MKEEARIVLSDIIRLSEKRLAHTGVESPGLDARILTAHALGLNRAQLTLQEERVLDLLETKKIDSFMARREKREPVSRIIGEREFWGLPFALNEATLDPRPDSETLVSAALSKSWKTKPNIRILDLGTGTGCLLLSLLYEMPAATGIGIDKSEKAVEQAHANSVRLGLSSRAVFRAGDWFEGINEKFDLIVCNPPYIARLDILFLAPEVREYDPPIALDGGIDGLEFYRLLIPWLPRFLQPWGMAVFECGWGQAEAVCEMFKNSGFSDIEIFKDLAGVDRCATAGLSS